MSSDDFVAEVVGVKNSLPFLHTWKLERLFSFLSSSGKMWDYSGVFPAGGYSCSFFRAPKSWCLGGSSFKRYIWKLALKSGELEAQDGKSYLSLFMALVDASPPPFLIEVALEVSTLNENYSQCSKRKVIHRFRQSKRDECHPYLISLETLECPFSGFLVAEIIDVVIHLEEIVSFFPKSENNSLAYTWKIDGFSKLTKGSYNSGPFVYNDHIWYLAVYPKGHLEEKNKSISLFLYLDDASNLASSGKIRAEFYVDWVNQINEKNHQCRDPHVFDRNSPGWGWRKFLSLDALRDPSRGLLVNDTCIIKVGFVKCDIYSKCCIWEKW